uniref:Uncharacterized protein n=1 Tax=Capsaspora owczarzaki TaxID=192875 RepID=M1JZJ0_9EUKA|nr:hypothetical protein [Capsaspora owczarzaki]
MKKKINNKNYKLRELIKTNKLSLLIKSNKLSKFNKNFLKLLIKQKLNKSKLKGIKLTKGVQPKIKTRIDLMEQISIINKTSKIIEGLTGKELQIQLGVHQNIKTANIDMELTQLEIVEAVKQVLWFKSKSNSFISKKINNVVNKYMYKKQVMNIPRVLSLNNASKDEMESEQFLSYIFNYPRTERLFLLKLIATLNSKKV